MWLNMDRPTNLMVIDAVLWFDGPLDWARLARVVERRLLDRFPVFRQRPVRSLLGSSWVDDPDFELSRHLVRATLPAPGDHDALERFVEARMQEPLDREHPMWRFHLVDGLRGGGSAVMARFHHSLADGMALAEVLLSLTDEEPDADLADPAGRAGDGAGAGVGGPPVRTGRLTTDLLTVPVRTAAGLLARAPRLARPGPALEGLTLARQAGTVAEKLLLRSNPPTPLSAPPGIGKRAVWSAAVPVPELRRVARLAGGTVNDVLVGAVSGSITSYLHHLGAEPPDLTTMVPVNLRPAGQPLPPELGNRFALVLLPLPTGSRSPLTRLAESKRRMDAIKSSPEAVITFGLINAIGRTHPSLERVLVDYFAGKAIGVTTNVIGPAHDRFVAGRLLEGILAWVPGSGRQTLGACIVSYGGLVRVGFKTDATVVPDPEHLVGAFDQEVDDLVRMAASA
jgi:WS/DGAT/MGAT family acyltransferase